MDKYRERGNESNLNLKFHFNLLLNKCTTNIENFEMKVAQLLYYKVPFVCMSISLLGKLENLNFKGKSFQYHIY